MRKKQDRDDSKFNPDKLNSAIKNSGKNIPTLHKETQIPLTTLYDWSNGRVMPKFDGMKKIAECLGVRMEDLIE